MSKKTLIVIAILLALIFSSCQNSIGPILGNNTTTYKELTDGRYRGIKGVLDNRILFDITIATDSISKIKTVELKAYSIDPGTNQFFSDPYLWLEGTYINEDYYSQYSDVQNPRWLYNWPIARFEFTKQLSTTPIILPSDYNSYFSYNIANTQNSNTDDYQIIYSPTINSKINFCEAPLATESFRPLASWLSNLVLTKTTL